MEKKITINVQGTVTGFVKDGETDLDAKIRLVLLAETFANEKGDPRLHLEFAGDNVPA